MRGSGRGKQKPKLRDLGRIHPDLLQEQELRKHASIESEPITAAIVGASLVEIQLEQLLRYKLGRLTDEQWHELIDEAGPLGTFHRKIILGRTLKLYGDEVKANLEIVRNIRNAFAHAKRFITFDHELVVSELRKVKIPKTQKRIHKRIKEVFLTGQFAYIELCHEITMALIRRYTNNLRSLVKYKSAKAERIRLANLVSDARTQLQESRQQLSRRS